MNKEEIIRRYGEGEYKRRLQQTRDWQAQHREEHNVKNKEWNAANPERVIELARESCRKGGKYYEKRLAYQTTGLRGERNVIRATHARKYRPFKQTIAPDSEIQHEWLPGTAKYRGVALVEKDQHRHGIIDVIKILGGGITLFTEREIKEQETN